MRVHPVRVKHLENNPRQDSQLSPAVDQINLPALHPAQQRILDEARRYNVAACGRRFGKSYLALRLLADIALAGKPAGYFAPTYKLLLDMWEAAISLFRPLIKRSSAEERRIELAGGGLIEMWTLEDEAAGRSRKYARVVIDEAGLSARLGRIYREAIRPTLADLEGDAWLLGTPQGHNFFWECWQRGQDPEETEWASWQLPTSANPHIAQEEIAEMQRDLPERSFRQEVLAEFLADGGGVFRSVALASIATPQTIPNRRHEYVGGIDWGRSRDYTAIALWDATAKRQVVLERTTGEDYMTQAARVIELTKAWKVELWLVEENGMGGPMISYLRERDVPIRAFTTTQASKLRLIDDYALGFEGKRFQLLNDPVQINEHLAFTAETLPGGLVRYGAPEGRHDDTVIANALAWQLAKTMRDAPLEEAAEDESPRIIDKFPCLLKYPSFREMFPVEGREWERKQAFKNRSWDDWLK